jgi:exopolyphosphatase/guanosine-5'-triphosphate,3'-diphosphate pyrophosphatase
MSRRVAAIDCGTNSLRMLIADIDPVRHTLTDVERRMEIVRLGQGVDATGRLAPEALRRTLRMLAEYAAQITAAKAEAVRMVATSATRDASNAAEFSRGVHDVLGVLPEVISGSEEATLSFTGATAELVAPDAASAPSAASAAAGKSRRPPPPYLVVDIGGGSTEFVLGSGQDAELAGVSVDIGCVRLTERHLHSDPPTEAEIRAACDDIDRALDDVAAAVPVTTARTLVGLAGSVTTVTAIGLNLPGYDPSRIHHARMSVADVGRVTSQLLSQTHDQRARIAAMHPGRVDVIGAGALILNRLMERFGFAELVTSEHDILDGIAWSVAGDA